MARNFLEQIVAHKQEEIAAARERVPEDALRAMAAEHRQRRPFLQRLTLDTIAGVRVIAEIKRASPSKGPIRPNLNPASLARAYEIGGAAALSVLTDTAFFHGSLQDLRAARQATELPVLRKDFLISSYQIYESAAGGADAVLLIARILTGAQLQDYLSLCTQLHLDALVEINSESDLSLASRAGARLIGINNRDLRTFKTDLHTTRRLAALLAPGQIGVAASGIQNRSDIDRLLTTGMRGFLVGESLVRAKDPVSFLQSLTGADSHSDSGRRPLGKSGEPVS